MTGLALLLVVSLAAPLVSGDEVLAWLLHQPLQGRAGSRRSAIDVSDAGGSSSSLFDPYQHLRLCNSDRVCERREFCDLHYGVCREKVGVDSPCRRDGMCARNLHCMFGKCQPRVEPGREGARCRRGKDCGSNMCCARRNGERICQRRLSLGHKCFVPEGGPDYAINERCPCESGLICKYTSPEPPPRDPTVIFWTTFENMRCVPPSHSPHSSR